MFDEPGIMKSRNGDFELGSHLNIDGTHIVDDPLEPLVDAERQLVPLPRRLLLGVLVLPRRRANVLLKRVRVAYVSLSIIDSLRTIHK